VPLGLSALRTVKRWYADELCAAVATDLVPWPRAPLSKDDPRAMTVFEQVEWVGGERIEWECAWPGVRVADSVDVELLGVAAAAHAHQLQREKRVPGIVRWGLIRTVRRS
jgi:hypothetical protein